MASERKFHCFLIIGCLRDFFPACAIQNMILAGGIPKYGFVEFPQVAIVAQFQIDLNLYIGLLTYALNVRGTCFVPSGLDL